MTKSKASKKSLGPGGRGLFLQYGNDGTCGGQAHVFFEDCRQRSDGLGFKSLCGFRTVVINGGIKTNRGRDKCSDCMRLVPGVVARELARRKTAWARWITSKRRERMIVRIMKLVEKADRSAIEAAIYELRTT
jgi:hypothetical protein